MTFDLVEEKNFQKVVDYIVKNKGGMNSEVFAALMGLTHRQVNQAISRHKNLISAASDDGTNIMTTGESKLEGTVGRPEIHYILNRTQILVLAGLIRHSENKDQVIVYLSKAFIKAIDQISDLQKKLREIADVDMMIELSEYSPEEKLNQILDKP